MPGNAILPYASWRRPIVCGISFGYSNKAHPANSFRTSRKDIRQAASWVLE